MTEAYNQCGKCGLQKLLSEFGKRAAAKNGLQGYCRDCQRAYAKAVYHSDPKASKIKSREWQLKNREKQQNYYSKWSKLTAESRKAYNKQWNELNREAISERNAQKYKLDPEKQRNIHRAWKLANPERLRALHAKRRANIAKAPGSHTSQDIKNLMLLQKMKCIVCRTVLKKFHVDHVQPIARGGDNSASNLQLLCPSCNLSKGSKDPIAFMQSRRFLL